MVCTRVIELVCVWYCYPVQLIKVVMY